MHLHHRRFAGLLAIVLVAATGCSAATALGTGSAASDTDTTNADIARPTSTTSTTTSRPTPPATRSTSTTTSTTTTTTTTTTIVPVTLPEREVREVASLDAPLEPVGTSSGEATERAKWRLVELGFWLDDPEGEYGLTTRQAVMAFQKYYGLEADGVLGPITAEALTEATERPEGRSTAGDLVEVDKSKQLVFIVQDGVTEWVLNASTGTEVPYDTINRNTGEREVGDSVTRTGVHAVNRQREEGWWEGDLGEIYRPKYFDGGIALHGANSVPNYPASHGCVRVSVPAMDWIWDEEIVPFGMTVWVHGEIPGDD